MIKLIIIILLAYWGYKEYKPKIDTLTNRKTEFSIGKDKQNKPVTSKDSSDKEQEDNSLLNKVNNTKKDIETVNNYIDKYNEIKTKTIEKIKETYEKFTKK